MHASLLHTFGIFVFAGAWLVPDHYSPWASFHAEALALLGISLLAAGKLVSPGMQKGFAIPRLTWGLVILALLPWMQWFVGISLFAGDAVIVSLYLCALAVAVALGYACAHDATDTQQGLAPVFLVICFVAFASAAIGLLQWMDLQGMLGIYATQTALGTRAMGNLGQPNQLASLLLMGIAALAWTYERRRIGPLGLVCGVGFLSLVLMLTQSRAGILSAIAAVLLFAWKSRSTALRIRPGHAAGWLVCFLLALQLLPWVHAALLMDEGRNLSLIRDNGRFIIWRQVFGGILESPWVGYGWNQTPTAQALSPVDLAPSSAHYTYTNAHNAVLDLMAWNGIPLGLALALACIYWFFSRTKAIKEANPLYAMLCLLPIAIHSLLEYPFAYSYFLLSAGLMIGIVEASWRNSAPVTMRRDICGVFLGAWFVVGCYAAYEYIQVERDFRVVRFESLRIGKTPAEYRPPDGIWMLSHLSAMLKAARQEAKRDMAPDEMQNLRKAALRFPYGMLALRYALALGLNGHPQDAERQMLAIRRIYGKNYYQAAVSVLRTMEREKYPELREVKTP
ncbi:PglL family O-oligosaccharyltransferase [Verminephrobacter aporrectodeae]|uniref:PglL family O-oligosaccharyltransferase n=1 Tax=Verminephrobacter aporrectodeae TaxID=1110389 RepID=UPI0022378608|nr:O-antigen ligase family protein [Verminephrobacter aporrectodeae]